MGKSLKKKNLPVDLYETYLENESLIASYFCSIRREIMIQGKLYITLNCVIFYAKFFKKTISIVIDFKDVQNILKERTAYLFPNAIVFCCSSNIKHTFYSFMCRDKVFVLLYNIYSKNLYSPDQLPSGMSSPHSSTDGPSECSPSSLRNEEIPITDEINNLFDVSNSSLPPEESVSCEGHSHPGKELVSSDYFLSAHKLFSLLFMNSDFIKHLFEKMNAYLISISRWDCEGDSKRRNVEYCMKTSTSFGHIVAQIHEEQILEPSTRLGAVYIIRTISHTKGVMYSDSFHTEMLYCITSNCPISCHLKVHANLIMKPNTFILARKLITTNGIAKITEYCRHISDVISENIGGESETLTNNSDRICQEKFIENYGSLMTHSGWTDLFTSFVNDRIDSVFITNLLLGFMSALRLFLVLSLLWEYSLRLTEYILIIFIN